ncbi:MAG: PKD domain-containing protein, partial [Candidatus Thermoplasmatota archaeon]|nr:PKD domain-containing protein [Candidatus Thermoplasmatota archaeon]
MLRKKILSICILILLSISIASLSILADEKIEENTIFPYQTANSDLSLNFSIKENENWVNEIESPVGTELEFKITVNGAYGLYLIVTTVLPEMLTYLNATPPPHEVSPNEYGSETIIWYYDAGGGSRSFFFKAEITKNQTSNCLATSVMILPPQSDNKTVLIHGTTQYPPLLVNANGPYEATISEDIQFNGSVEGGTPPFDYHWDFRDGNHSEQLNPIHRYSTVGNYSIIFAVTDSRNITAEDTASASVTIKEEDEDDTTRPFVEITKPKSALYLFNRRILPFPKPVVIGNITVE